MLRTQAGRDPYDRALTDLVGELSTCSEDFRTRWAAHDVRLHPTGINSSATRASATSTCTSSPWT